MVTEYETIYGDPIGLDEENVPAGASFPSQLTFGIPKKPVQTPVNAMDYYLPFLLDDKSYLKVINLIKLYNPKAKLSISLTLHILNTNLNLNLNINMLIKLI